MLQPHLAQDINSRDGSQMEGRRGRINLRQQAIPILPDDFCRRWTIERAYATIKRLLGLAYFWCGSQNAVELQLWSTWIVYTVLIDLCDEVAGLLRLPLEHISIEMVFRSIYYYVKAVERGDTQSLPVYLADRSADLSIVKRKRKNQTNVFKSWPLTIASDP